MNKGGRPRSLIWEHFITVGEGTSRKAQCKICFQTFAGKPARMETHRNKCLKAQGKTSQIAQATNVSQRNCTTEPNSSVSVPVLVPPSTPPPPTSPTPALLIPPTTKHTTKQKQPHMDSHVIKTTATEKGDIDQLIADFIFATNLPFQIVEHPYFHRVCSALRPGYKPPTAKQVGSQLLDYTHARLQSTMKSNLDGKVVTLQQDGWTNIKDDPIIATTINSDGQSFFLDAVEPGCKKKTSDLCKDMLLASIKDAEDLYGCKVANVVTDNEAKMKKMRQDLMVEKPLINAYGCVTHNLSLLGRDITNNKVMEHVKTVNHHFKHVHRAHAWLSKCPGHIKPKLPSPTRWNSDFECLHSYLHNHTHYKKIATEYKDDIDPTISNKIKNIGILVTAEDLCEQLRPISQALTRAQSDSFTIADATDCYISLLADPVLQPHLDKIHKRFEECILPFHFAAYLLHPKYQGKALTPAQKEAAFVFIQERDPEFLATVISFEAHAAPFPQSYFSPGATSVAPVSWWLAISRSAPLPEGFIQLVTQLHTAIASSSSIERVFSSFGLVHSKLRNRLGNDKAAKLVFCYRMLRGVHEIDY